MTGKIYHINNFPPETEEVKARLVTRPDDTEEKVCNSYTIMLPVSFLNLIRNYNFFLLLYDEGSQ